MDYNIEKLLELSKNCKPCVYGLTDARYAIKDMENGLYAILKDTHLICTSPKAKRFISIYGDDIENAKIYVDYSLPDFPMFDSKFIKDNKLIPLHKNNIPKYFEITDTVISHEKSSDAETINIKHEDTIHYKYNHHLVDLNNI